MLIAERSEDVQQPVDGPLCVLAASLEDPQAVAAAALLALELPRHPSAPRRPSAAVLGEQIDLALFVLGPDQRVQGLQLFARPAGLLVVGPAEAVDQIRAPLGLEHEDAMSALVAVTLAVARRGEQALDQLDDECRVLQEGTAGYTSSPERRTMGRMRAHLFHLEQIQAAQAALLAPDEELAQSLGAPHRRLLRRAATVFDANRALVARLYAMLGDVLAEQDTIVSERLTLVATIFLPLTLATGFFGMNFGWLTERIGGTWAFLGLGVVGPGLLTLLTLLLVRRLTRSS
ncbi:CorA family divalent cation transporter [Brachybacterium hainanense]|uniref:CorA family divalent cation transporter n=1 Tax=Brachybacterium hainanense TaxID=1541174 RepID=A0ABV6R9K4_9MICO